MSTDEKTILQRLGHERTIEASEDIDTLRDIIRRGGLDIFSIRLGTIGADTVIFLDKDGQCVVHRALTRDGVREISMYLAGYGDAGGLRMTDRNVDDMTACVYAKNFK